MAIPSRQIGWSQKSNLLWQISKQLEYLTGVMGRNIPANTTTTTSSSTSTTTSTSTTIAPVVYSFAGKWSFMDRAETCQDINFNPATYYSTTPLGSVTNGTQIFTNAGLTTTPSQPFISVNDNSYSNSGGVLSGGLPCPTTTTTTTTAAP